MNIEDELRGALDAPAPPTAIRLEDVIKRGRRRIYARWAGGTLTAVGVVAAIGVSGYALPSLTPAAPPPIPPVSTCAARQPETPLVDEYGSYSMNDPVFTEEDGVGLMKRFMNKLFEASPFTEFKVDHQGDSVNITLVYDAGRGSVRLTKGRVEGTPDAAAENFKFATRSCDLAVTTRLPSGVVVQLHGAYQVGPNGHTSQVLFVYRLDGTAIRIEQNGPDRSPLPLRGDQLQKLGLVIAEAG